MPQPTPITKKSSVARDLSSFSSDAASDTDLQKAAEVSVEWSVDPRSPKSVVVIPENADEDFDAEDDLDAECSVPTEEPCALKLSASHKRISDAIQYAAAIQLRSEKKSEVQQYGAFMMQWAKTWCIQIEDQTIDQRKQIDDRQQCLSYVAQLPQICACVKFYAHDLSKESSQRMLEWSTQSAIHLAERSSRKCDFFDPLMSIKAHYKAHLIAKELCFYKTRWAVLKEHSDRVTQAWDRLESQVDGIMSHVESWNRMIAQKSVVDFAVIEKNCLDLQTQVMSLKTLYAEVQTYEHDVQAMHHMWTQCMKKNIQWAQKELPELMELIEPLAIDGANIAYNYLQEKKNGPLCFAPRFRKDFENWTAKNFYEDDRSCTL